MHRHQRKIDGETGDGDADDGDRQPEHEHRLHLVEHLHDDAVRPERHVFGRLEAGAHQVDAADDEQRQRRHAGGGVDARLLVGQHVHVMQQDDEAEEEHADGAEERVVDEGGERNEDEASADVHAGAARRP